MSDLMMSRNLNHLNCKLKKCTVTHTLIDLLSEPQHLPLLYLLSYSWFWVWFPALTVCYLTEFLSSSWPSLSVIWSSGTLLHNSTLLLWVLLTLSVASLSSEVCSNWNPIHSLLVEVFVVWSVYSLLQSIFSVVSLWPKECSICSKARRHKKRRKRRTY